MYQRTLFGGEEPAKPDNDRKQQKAEYRERNREKLRQAAREYYYRTRPPLTRIKKTDEELMAARQERQRRYKRENREKVRAAAQAYRKRMGPEQRARNRAASKRWREQNPGWRNLPEQRRARAYGSVRYKFGLSPESFDAMLIAQCGRCDICDEQMQRVMVDHDHQSGKVRSLLCTLCNNLCGYLEHPEHRNRLRAAIRYLKRHRR